jgi:hypothetical protein
MKVVKFYSNEKAREIAKALGFVLSILLLSILFKSCTADKCTVTNTYMYYSPVETSLTTIRTSVIVEPAREIESAGRIYFKDDYLFINEPGEGIHIIDNRIPESPVKLNFLKIPGNYDLAIRGPFLYTDSYMDLLTFDVSDVRNIRLVNREENVLRADVFMGFTVDQARNMVITYKQEQQVEISENDCSAFLESWGGRFWGGGIIMLDFAANPQSANLNISPGGNSTGVGGSMARFTIVDKYLYMLNGSGIETAVLDNPVKPEIVHKLSVGWGLETVFPYQDKIFIGSTTGMHIISLQNPASPTHLSTYQHFFACDPVVVEGKYAYVTLRTGTNCRMANLNVLEVIDISNVLDPRLVKSYPMHNPHGLGIDDGILFLCDGDAGLKIFDAKDPLRIDKNVLARYPDINAYDVIPLNNVLMMIGKGGLYQYSYSDPNNVRQISHIRFNN